MPHKLAKRARALVNAMMHADRAEARRRTAGTRSQSYHTRVWYEWPTTRKRGHNAGVRAVRWPQLQRRTGQLRVCAREWCVVSPAAAAATATAAIIANTERTTPHNMHVLLLLLLLLLLTR